MLSINCALVCTNTSVYCGQLVKKHQKSNDEIQICKNAMSISDMIEYCTWAVYFFVCRSKDEHKMVGFAYCRCSNFHFSLNTSRIYSSCVLCVNPLCRSVHFHISILIYGKCYSVVCLTTGTKVHLYLLQKLHNPHTTQGDVHIFRNFYIWFVFFFFNYSGVFFFFVFCTLSVSAQIYTPTLLFKVHVVGAFKKDQTVETGRQWRKNLQDNLQMWKWSKIATCG